MRGSPRHLKTQASQPARPAFFMPDRFLSYLQKLEDAGLVASVVELSADGKALNYFDVSNFDFQLTPAAIAEAAKSLSTNPE